MWAIRRQSNPEKRYPSLASTSRLVQEGANPVRQREHLSKVSQLRQPRRLGAFISWLIQLSTRVSSASAPGDRTSGR